LSVSILIPIHNEAPYIAQLLDNLLQQDYTNGSLEILLIDGQSTDGTCKVIEQCLADQSRMCHFNQDAPAADKSVSPPRHITPRDETHDSDIATYLNSKSIIGNSKLVFRLLNNPARITPTALNIGIHEAKGDIIIRMDAHTLYAPDYITKCVEVLESTRAWNVGGPARTIANSSMQRAIAAAYHSPFSVGGARFHNSDYEGNVDTVMYGCWRKETLEQLGGFDEELVRNQDDELNFRIMRAGGTMYQTPEIKFWYYPRASLKSLWRQYFQYGYWKVRVIQKHKLPASPRHLIPILFVLGLIIGLPLNFVLPLFATIYFSALVLYAFLTIIFSIHAVLHLPPPSKSMQSSSQPVIKSIDLSSSLTFILLLPVFLTYHLSYGFGFLTGLINFFVFKRKPSILVSSPTR